MNDEVESPYPFKFRLKREIWEKTEWEEREKILNPKIALGFL